MALNEACQVWIEQRIEEELADQTDNGKSIVRIATELQAEIEKVFQAKLSITCLRSKVSRKRCANAQQPGTPATTPVQAGNSGNKLTPQEVVVQVALPLLFFTGGDLTWLGASSGSPSPFLASASRELYLSIMLCFHESGT